MVDEGQRPPAEKSPEDFVTLGVIVRTHGLKGEVKVRLTCSGIDRLKNCDGLRLVKDGGEIKRVSVERAFLHNDGDAILRLREVVGVEEAQSLRGAALAVPANERAKPSPGEYYVDDLVGLNVEEADGKTLGRVEEVLEMPANWVCVVREGEREILVPFLKSVVREVDLKARRMKVDLPEEMDGDALD